MSKFGPIKPSRSGDISHLVFKISKEAVKQPCLDQKIQYLFPKYSYFLRIFPGLSSNTQNFTLVS